MTSVRAIRIHDKGGPDVLSYDTIGLEAPGPGEALVRHEAIGVNFIDTYHRSGLYALDDLPRVIGMEAAGCIEALGEGVTEMQVGDRVGYVNAGVGAYAEARVVPADKLIPIPESVSSEQAAAVMLQGMTVEYLVRRVFPVKGGMNVLWHAAAGGVGLIGCQWLSHLGATIIGTVSTQEKADLAKSHGCTHPVLYTEEDFVKRVHAITGGEGVHVAFDSVGKDTFFRSMKCVRRRGMLVGYGNASGPPEPMDPLELVRNGSLFMTRPSLMHYVDTREELVDSASALFELVAQGVISAQPRHRWPLAEAAACHRALEARETIGSIILVP